MKYLVFVFILIISSACTSQGIPTIGLAPTPIASQTLIATSTPIILLTPVTTPLLTGVPTPRSASPTQTPIFNIVIDNALIDPQGGLFASGFGDQDDLRHFAHWDGANWTELGKGFQTSGNTFVVDGEGYLYTDTLSVSEQGTSTAIMRWDGSSWEDITGNFISSVDELKARRVSSNIPITALAVDGDDNLYAAGMFYYSTADYTSELPMGYVAMWDGQTWTVLGSGLDTINLYALAVSPEGNVYVSGEQPATPQGNNCYIAHWERGKWMEVNTGDLNWCSQSLVMDKLGHLYVAGQSNTTGVLIAYWDNPKWTLITSQLGGEAPAVYNMAVDKNGQLCIGGSFNSVSRIPAQNIACWDGTAWQALRNGVNERVNALAFSPDGELYVVGFFTQAGGLPARHAARWDGVKWHALGED